MKKTIRIGTRGSLLALTQARMVQSFLMNTPSAQPGGRLDVQIITFKTSGDRIQDQSLAKIGGKGLFTKEIEEALLKNYVDIAVHSLKDMAARMDESLVLPCFLAREEANDVFISRDGQGLMELKQGGVIGTSSIRRGYQTLKLRPDCKIVPYRGNVDTRLKKLSEGEVDGTFLALAGLKRLEKENLPYHIMPMDLMLPAATQGIIAIQCRAEDHDLEVFLRSLSHQETAIRVQAERSFMKILGGSCTTPVAAYSHMFGHTLHLKAQLFSPDGQDDIIQERTAPLDEAEELGVHVARLIRPYYEKWYPCASC